MTTCLGNMVYCFDADRRTHGWTDRRTAQGDRPKEEGGSHNLTFPLKSIC